MTDTVLSDAPVRANSLLERIERLYLTLLRAAVLVIATGVLVWAAWLGASATYRILRSPDSVVERPSTVDAAELEEAAPAKADDRGPAQNARAASPEQQRFYTGFVDRYYRLYRSRFEPFRQPDDKRLSRDEFDDNFVRSTDRMKALAEGDLDFAKDRADLTALFEAMESAATMPRTVERLTAYKNARKRRVERQVRRTRTESRRGWDSYSTVCSNWYESPVGCAVTRRVEIPYTQTVATMALPEGTVSHTRIFRAMQDRYFELLQERRTTAANDAAAEREAIEMGQGVGWDSLTTMLWVLGGFLLLMFFFLLIAIERHQRRLVSASMA